MLKQWLTDSEKRILFSALSREKEVCIKVDKEMSREKPNERILERVCKNLEYKFFYDRLFQDMEKQIRADEREKIIAIIHSFFRDEMDKLETDYDGIDEYYKDTQKVDMFLHMNKEICTRIKEQK